jgi:hypothetical protein
MTKEVEIKRKPTNYEIGCYARLAMEKPFMLKKAAAKLDEGMPPEEVANVVAGGQLIYGIWLVLACNYMILTGTRPQ